MTCQHRHCTCVLTDDSGFCSEYCQREADNLEIGASNIDDDGGVVADCGCGHADCSGGGAPVI